MGDRRIHCIGTVQNSQHCIAVCCPAGSAVNALASQQCDLGSFGMWDGVLLPDWIGVFSLGSSDWPLRKLQKAPFSNKRNLW